MNTELKQRLDAIKAECKQIIALSEKAHQAPWHAKIEPNRELLMFGQKVLLAAGDFARRDDDIRFIAHARNVSPALARVVLCAIEQWEIMPEVEFIHHHVCESALKGLANEWAPCSPLPASCS